MVEHHGEIGASNGAAFSGKVYDTLSLQTFNWIMDLVRAWRAEMMIIDPPSRFAPKQEWRAHLKRMRFLAKDRATDEAIAEAIRDAEDHLASLD